MLRGGVAKRYLDKGFELLQRLQDTQPENIEQAAGVIAEAVADGHTLYARGGPYSSLPVQDIFWPAGGLVLVNPAFTHGLSCWTVRTSITMRAITQW